MAYVYILHSLKTDKYYIGSTTDYLRRLDEHNSGKSKATKSSIPWRLVFYQQFESISVARSVEYQLKAKKSRKIIQQIINDGIIKFMRE